ncbi:Transcription factor with AP2 domain(S) [Plasmodium coatneyi]|uniref:Transcription factor with AP2 domain(S) n=1 Tax=Plasmodium coatneyi TaxID=208452 RepID=A0A1B1E6H5_9APIC|nr:Transcription factor with AP2 domain(S) [Plasmodium coatneyi]ANQ10632.1 Transcription factor with AP2 domain(S) [Plasmodium coatneyi]
MVNAASNLRSLCFGAFKSFNKKYEEDNNVREAEEEDEGGGEEADGDGGGCKEGIGHRGEGVSEEYCAEEEEMGNTHNHAIDIGSSVEKNTKTDYTFDGNNCADGNEEDVTHNEHPYPEGEEKFTLNVSTGGVSSSSTTATPPCEVKTDEPSYCTSGSNQRERSSTLDATVFGEINKGANIFMGNRNKECPVNSNLNADVNLNTDADIGLHPFKNASVYNGAKVCDDPNMWSSFNGGNNIGAVNTASTLSTDVCNNASYLYSGEVHVRNDVVQDRKVDKGTATVTMVTDVEEFRKENYSTEEDRYDKSESKIYNRHTGEKVMRKKISAHTGVNDAALTASSANVERILMDYYRGKINSKNYEEKLSNSCRFFIYTSNPYNYDVKMIKENCLTIYQLLYREKKKWCSIYICTNDGPMSNFNYHLYKILCGKEDIYMYFFLLKKFIFSCYIYFNLVSIKIFSTFSNKGENIMLYDFTHIIKGKNASLGESSGEFGGSSDCGGAERKQQWDQLSQKSIRQSPGQSPRHASSQSTPHLPTVVEAVRGRSLSPSGGTNQHHANPFGATTWENQAEECNRETETPPQRNRSSNIYNLNSENNQIEEEAQFLNFLYDPCKHLYVNKVNSSDNYFHLFNKEESSDIKKKLQLFISTHSPTMINITKRWNSFYLNKNRISSFVEKYKDVNYSSGDNLKKNGKERFISEFVETFCVMIDEVNPPRRSRTNMVVRQHSEGMHLRRGGTSRKALSWMAKHGRGRPSITKKEYEAGNTRWPHKLRRAYTTADEVTDMGDKNCNRDRSGSYGDRFGRSFGHFDEKARSVSMGGGTHHYTTGGKFEWRGETAEEGKNTSNAEDQPEGNPPSEHTNMKAPQTTDGESKKTPPSVVEPNRVPNYSSSSQWYKEGMGTSGCTAEVIAKFLGSVNIRRSRMLLRKGGGSSGSDSDDSVGARESDSNQDSCDSDEQNTESESAYYGGKKYSNNGEGVTTNGEDGGKRGKKHPRNHIFLNNLNILIKDLNELYDYLENCRYGGGTRADGVGVNNSFFINDPKGSYHSAFGKGDNGGGEPEATDEVHDANRVQHGEAMNTEYLNRLKSGRNLSNLYSIGASCVDGGTYSDAGNSETSNAYGRGEEDFYNVDISSVDLKNFCSVCSGIQYDNFENPLNEGKNGKYKRLEVFMKESDFFCNCNNINIFQNENGNPNEDLKFGFNGEMTSEEYYMLRKNDIEKMNRTIDEIIYMNHQQGLGGSAGEGTDGGLPYENDDYEEEDDDEDDEADEDDDSDDEDDEGRTKVALKTRRKSTNVGEGVGITTGPGRRRGRVAKMELKSKYMGRGKNKMWANNTAAKDLSNKAATNREIRNMRKNKFGKYHQQTEKKNKTVKSLASPQNYEIKSARVKKLEKFTSVDQENLREVFGPTGVSGVYFEKSRSSWTAQYKVSGGKRRAKRFLVTKNMTYEEIENVKQQCIAYRKQMEKEYIKEFLNEDKKKTPSSVTSPSSEIGHVSVKKNKRRRKMKSFYDS